MSRSLTLLAATSILASIAVAFVFWNSQDDGPRSLAMTSVKSVERAIEDAATRVRGTKAGSTISFESCASGDWDSFFVVSPYASPRGTAKKLGVTELSRLMEPLAGLGEMECMLVFVERESVVGSLLVPRVLVDFSDEAIVHALMPSSTTLVLEFREEFNGIALLQRVVARRG